MTNNRRCVECDISDDQTVLFTIMLPPELPDKVSLCRTCLDQVIDNSKNKNRAKRNE